MLLKLGVLAILIWSFFQIEIASTVFIVLIVLVESYQFFIDKIGKPKINQLKLSDAEFKALQKYHIYFRFPFASRSVSSTLSAIQLSSFIWVPWLLYNHFWWQAVFVAANYLIAAHFAFKLNPGFFLYDAVYKKGKLEFELEMKAVDSLTEKIFKKKIYLKKPKKK